MFSIIPLKHRHHFSTFIMLYACIPAVYKNIDCEFLEKVNLPNSINEIQYETFSYCSSLAHIDIPEGVINMGFGAFENC